MSINTSSESPDSGLVPNPCLVGLSEADLAADPVTQFQRWFDRVLEAKLPEPNAMTLATSSPNGVPSARVVLLKGFDREGFVFFTNYDSQKGRELTANPHVALVMFWPTLERQVRIVGTAMRVSRAESEAYFQSRPLGSQLGAWASLQSSVLRGREELERRLEEVTARFGGGPVPLPPNWGGFRVKHDAVEFWQARPNRLHDRFLYSRETGDRWKVARLSP